MIAGLKIRLGEVDVNPVDKRVHTFRLLQQPDRILVCFRHQVVHTFVPVGPAIERIEDDASVNVLLRLFKITGHEINKAAVVKEVGIVGF